MEITHMDWPRAVLHTGVSEVDSASLGEIATQQRRQKVSARERHGLTVRGAVPWKNTHVGSPEGESLHTGT